MAAKKKTAPVVTAPPTPAVPAEPPLLVPELVIDERQEAQKRRAAELARRLDGLVITSPDSLQAAADLYSALGDAEDAIHASWEPLTSAAFKLHRELVARRDSAKALAGEPKQRVAALIAAYRREQDRLRREAEDRARAEREEQQRILDAAHADALLIEQQRLEAERAQQIKEAHKSGDRALARELKEAPPPVASLPPPPPAVVESSAVVPAPARAAGVSMRTGWTYTLDPADGSGVKRDYCIPDARAIKALVSRMGERDVGVVGGIRVEPDYSIARSGSRGAR